MRASAVVKRHSTGLLVRLRCSIQALTSLRSVSMSAIRRAKHCRASTLNSHSAMFSQLPCFGVYTNSSLSSNARALAGSKVLYSDAPGVRTQVVHQQRDPAAPADSLLHQPAHPFRPVGAAWFGATSVRRQSSNGA